VDPAGVSEPARRSGALPSSETFDDPPALRRGINLGGWLSQLSYESSHVSTFVSAATFDEISELGFDHVRIPVDEMLVFPNHQHERPSSFALDVLGAARDWAVRAGLTVILDLHQTRDHSFLTPGRNELWRRRKPAERLVRFWTVALDGLGSSPTMLVDLLNEPTIDDPATWWRIAEQAMHAIRRRHPSQWIIVESTPVNGVKASPASVPHFPAAQPGGCLYGFHFYEPLAFTHQSASWSSIGKYGLAPQEYPGFLRASTTQLPSRYRAQFVGPWDRARLHGCLVPHLAWAAERNVRLHCGEFGAYVDGPPPARYRWVADVVDGLEANGVGWAYWTYKNMGFGLRYDTERRRRQPEYVTGLDRELLAQLMRSA
jgi:endoglucanase